MDRKLRLWITVSYLGTSPEAGGTRVCSVSEDSDALDGFKEAFGDQTQPRPPNCARLITTAGSRRNTCDGQVGQALNHSESSSVKDPGHRTVVSSG